MVCIVRVDDWHARLGLRVHGCAILVLDLALVEEQLRLRVELPRDEAVLNHPRVRCHVRAQHAVDVCEQLLAHGVVRAIESRAAAGLVDVEKSTGSALRRDTITQPVGMDDGGWGHMRQWRRHVRRLSRFRRGYARSRHLIKGGGGGPADVGYVCLTIRRNRRLAIVRRCLKQAGWTLPGKQRFLGSQGVLLRYPKSLTLRLKKIMKAALKE